MDDDDVVNLQKVLEVAAAVPVVCLPTPTDPDNQVWIYSAGIVSCSVCAPGGMERDVVARQVNTQLPTGIKSKWKVSDDTHFKAGEPMPCDCPDMNGRKHWLLVC